LFGLRHDDTGKLRQGTVGASALQRQWMGLSQSGDQVGVAPLPLPPHPRAPLFLQNLELEVGFLRPKQEATEIFSADEMTQSFVEAFDGIIFSAGQSFAFQFRRQILRALVKSANVVELAQEQRRGASAEVASSQQSMGILMKKTDVIFMKAPDSAIKIKSSSKK
jgi:vesicle-fusing ATPase